MNKKILLWLFVVCIVCPILIIKRERFLKQCSCNEVVLTKSTSSEKKSTKDNEQKGRDFRVANSISNVKELSKIDEARPHGRSDDTNRNQGNADTSRPKFLVPSLDYMKYPCLAGYYKSERLRRLGRCIRTVNVPLLAKTVQRVECFSLHLNTSIPICIHDPRIDRILSRSIIRQNVWEKELIGVFLAALKKVNDIIMLDIGCNIGLYTLAAARERIRVVSIDANVENLRLLSKSLTLGEFTETVTLIWNALSDTYTNVSLKTHPTDVGQFSVRTDNKTISKKDTVIETILLDDLLYLCKGKPVGIKMDVELFELKVLKGGMEFLKNIDIRFIQMEISHHIKRGSAHDIVSLLRKFGFTPFGSCNGNQDMTDIPLTEWPLDVCFMKDKKNT